MMVLSEVGVDLKPLLAAAGLGGLAIGFIYTAYHLIAELSRVHSNSIFPFILLGLAPLVALGFEFVNGFDDTASEVATVGADVAGRHCIVWHAVLGLRENFVRLAAYNLFSPSRAATL